MSKSYQPWTQDQQFLLPPSLRDWLPEGHLAWFILDVVSQIDLSPIENAIQSKDARGQRSYHPQMMVALLVYAYCTGVFSSRKIERATYEDVGFRVIAGNTQPYFTTINEFRHVHREHFARLFTEVLRLCRGAKLVKLGHVAIDGTKVRANASKHKAMSYQRMCEQERRLVEQVEELLSRADAADAQDDERYGASRRDEDLPEELQRREQRLARIREAKQELEAGARLTCANRPKGWRTRPEATRIRACSSSFAPRRRKHVGKPMRSTRPRTTRRRRAMAVVPRASCRAGPHRRHPMRCQSLRRSATLPIPTAAS